MQRRIEKISARCLDLPLLEPFETAQRRAMSSPTVLVEVTAGDVVGYGEATPVKYVTGEDVDTVVQDVAAAAELLEGAALSEYRLSSRKLTEALPRGKSARAGIEMAILDAVCKVVGMPLFRYLGGHPIKIETDVTIPICTPEHAKELVSKLSTKGFRLFKIKVGKEPEEDMARVVCAAEGARGSSFIIDANQGLSPSQAVKFVHELIERKIRVHLFEQPVEASDLAGMRYVTDNCEAPVYADESVKTPADAIEIVRYRAARGINVKLQKSGILGTLDIISICQSAGMQLMIGCMLESRIGQSAAVHIACGTSAMTVYDLDSDLLLADQPVSGGFERKGSALKVLDRPGLGCEIVESAL